MQTDDNAETEGACRSYKTPSLLGKSRRHFSGRPISSTRDPEHPISLINLLFKVSLYVYALACKFCNGLKFCLVLSKRITAVYCFPRVITIFEKRTAKLDVQGDVFAIVALPRLFSAASWSSGVVTRSRAKQIGCSGEVLFFLEWTTCSSRRKHEGKDETLMRIGTSSETFSRNTFTDLFFSILGDVWRYV